MATSAEGVYGTIIKWLKPENELNLNNLVQNVDYIIMYPNKPCPLTNGEPYSYIDVDGKKVEWMVKETINEMTEDVDTNIYNIDTKKYPTLTKSITYENYNVFLTRFVYQLKSREELIYYVRQIEAAKNNSVLNESCAKKLDIFYKAVQRKRVEDPSSITEFDLAIENRQMLVEQRFLTNATNAQAMIDMINLVDENDPNLITIPDFESGWEHDNIPVCGFPFD